MFTVKTAESTSHLTQENQLKFYSQEKNGQLTSKPKPINTMLL